MLKLYVKLHWLKEGFFFRRVKLTFYGFVLELLKVIRETENDDLTSVMQRIVITFDREVTPLAVEMMTHLVSVMTVNYMLVCIDLLLFLVYEYSNAFNWHSNEWKLLNF